LQKEKDEITRADQETAKLIEEIRVLEQALASEDGTTIAKKESIEKLRADVKQLEEAKRRLSADLDTVGPSGREVRTFVGDGTRQYLSGLRIAGKRTLVLVDSSASMLDQTIVNVIRRRIQSEEQQLRSAKWRQVVATVDWITTQLEPEAEFQIYRFNETIEPLVAGTEGTWIKVGDGDELEEAVRSLRTTPPTGGTNLYSAFRLVADMNPRPDNVVLLVDGMPTRGENKPAKNTVSAGERMKLFGQAVRQLPSGIPINILMYPMEGDYYAPVEYWKLAYRSRGSFMSISDDWP
jgi:hypothetical protein